jgi:hypothetical protein
MRIYEKVVGELLERDEVMGVYVKKEAHDNSIVMTIKELKDLWAAANERGHQVGQYGPDGVYLDLKAYLFTTHGVTI